jgi:hypothetical protein
MRSSVNSKVELNRTTIAAFNNYTAAPISTARDLRTNAVSPAALSSNREIFG